MTRKIVSQLITDVAAAIPDNNSGLVTPANVRQSIEDVIDSVTPIIARISGTSAGGVAVPLTTTPSKIPAAFFTANLAGNPALLDARLAPNGDLLSHTSIGRLFVSFNVTVGGAAGVDIAFALAQNGVPITPRTLFTTTGAANRLSAGFSWLFTNLAANDRFDLYAYGLTTSPTITLYDAVVQGILLPQYIP